MGNSRAGAETPSIFILYPQAVRPNPKNFNEKQS